MSHRGIFPLALLAVAVLAGCSTPTRAEEEDAGVCRSPAGEFAAGACASLVGRVVDRNGAPLPGAGLSGFLRPDAACPCNSPGVPIDASGRFSSTVHWFTSAPPAGTEVWAWMRVTAIGPQYPQQPLVSDSVRVLLRFVPIGERVQPAEVELRLAVP